MLSCVHDPCINCAATHYVENEPHNSPVWVCWCRFIPAANAVKRHHWIRAASSSCKRCTVASRPGRKKYQPLARIKIHRRRSTIEIAKRYQSGPGISLRPTPELNSLKTAMARGCTRPPLSPNPAIQGSAPPKRPSTSPPIPATTTPKKNSLIIASPATGPSALSAPFTDSTENMRFKPPVKPLSKSKAYWWKIAKSSMPR